MLINPGVCCSCRCCTFRSGYPNPDCTIPAGDYYDFYDDCAAYTNWGKYFPDGAINSGPWSVELPTALGDTIAAVSYDGKPYIQGIAHGTEMGFNFHEDTEHDCYNPTEPGAWDDDTTAKWGAGWNQFPWLGPSTTAILAAPAYPSATSVTTAGPLPELPSLPDVMRIDGNLQVESTPGGTSQADGVFIAFLRCNFTSWLKLSPESDTFDPVPDPDSTAAPYSETQFAWLQDSPTGCGYGKQLSDQITFYGAPGAGRPAGTYAYRIYAAFGTLA
jgi:hypothetical protein